MGCSGEASSQVQARCTNVLLCYLYSVGQMLPGRTSAPCSYYVCLAADVRAASNAYASLSLVVLGLAKIRASDVTGGT